MSLKEFTKEIFTKYGLTETDINVYIRYLRTPMATMSAVYLSLVEEDESIEYATVEQATETLIENGFLKKIEGIVDRYIPLEPFFGLFVNQSEGFRNEIGKIKDDVLADQSDRFKKLEEIQDKSLGEVAEAVDNQIKAFFEDSDAKNTAKKERIDNAKNRFTDTSKALEKYLHDNVEKDFSELKSDVDQLNTELASITEGHNTTLKTLETNIHSIHDTLNSDLKSISGSFVSDNESAINNAKVNLNTLIAELLSDFSTRVSDLEKELKKDLDDHVERHKNIANDLKPRMEQILEKYLERMNKVITDLKEKISRILAEHTTHVKGTTDSLTTDLHGKVENRHAILTDLTNKFRNRALTLLENLIERSNRFSDFSEDIANQGFFFFGGKKKKFKARWEDISQAVAGLSRTYNDDIIKEFDGFVDETRQTTNNLKGDITDVMGNENRTLAAESKDLDNKAQETISAELQTLASDMASEIDSTLQGGVKDCSDTSIKLKDSLENSLKQHQKQYDDAITRHKEDSLRHYNDFDADIKRKNESWVKDVDVKFEGGKRDSSNETETQIKNNNEFKSKHENIVNERVGKVRTDCDNSKKITSEKIDGEISLWNGESADMDKNLTDMLNDHKSKYEENAKTLQNSLSNTTQDTIQNVKDAIADFTLQFMNSIDDATEMAENNEEKLKDIHTASSAIPEIAKVTTWHTIGRDALLAAIKDAVYRTKSSIIIVTPVVMPEVLQLISEHAYTKQAARFMLTSSWDLNTYAPIIRKMQDLGNIQFRNLNTAGEYYAITRDAEEVILAPATDNEAEMISIVSNQPQYARLYSQFIGPIFQANSRPVKL